MRAGEKLKPEEKYEIAYKNPDYMKASVGMAYTSWVLARLKFDSVLDVGCGCGYALLNFILHRKRVQGVEVCQHLLDTTLRTYAVAGIVQQARIQSLPFGENSFDLVYCTDVLEHIPEEDIPQAVSELVRVSKKYILVSVCTIPSQCMPELKLHETVKPKEWWDEIFGRYRIKLAEEPAVVNSQQYEYRVRAGDGYASLYIKY